MHTLLLALLSAALSCVSSDSSPDKAEVLMDNVLVLRLSKVEGSMVHVPLMCGEAYRNQPVFWKKNGEEFQPPLKGNQVVVPVEETNGGKYSCHLSPNGDYLNHTMIMVLESISMPIMLEEKSPEEGFIQCSAFNYDGSFNCTWTKSESRPNAAVLLVNAERHLEKIPCELNPDGLGVHCKDAYCPFKEEQHRISLTVYLHSYALLEAHEKSFYLRDIVRPVKLPNLSIRDGKVFSWSYPDSWERPCTFFGLQFQVKVVRDRFTCDSEEEQIMNGTTEETRFVANVKTKKYVFCVRAQDKYTSGPFGPWSHCIVNKQGVAC